MDSFVLAETFKYLYLLFDSIPHRHMDIDQFLFTTEAHLLPLNFFHFKINATLQREFDKKTVLSARLYEQKNLSVIERPHERRAKHNQCPAMDDQFKSHQYKEQLRRNIRGDRDMTETVTSTSMEVEKRPRNDSRQRLKASEFSAGNAQHVALLSQMGIQLQTMTDGRVQLIHNSVNAASSDDADDGLTFIHDMMELMKNTDGNGPVSESNYHLPLSVIPIALTSTAKPLRLLVGPAQFGRQLHGKSGVTTHAWRLSEHLFLFVTDLCSIECGSTVFWLFPIARFVASPRSCWSSSSWRLYVH